MYVGSVSPLRHEWLTGGYPLEFGHRVGVHGQLPAPIGEHVSPSVVAARAGPTTASPAGSYPITCTAGTLDSPNYSFTFQAGTLMLT
jgi:MBG domain (YGX type)